jgi:Peptidase family M48
VDPLALPRETTLRLLLVVMVVVAATLAVAESTWYGLYADDDALAVERCATADNPLRCRRPAEQRRVMWTLAWVPVVLGAAAVGAATGSAWRRRRLEPYPGTAVPAVAEVVGRVATAGPDGRSFPLLWRPHRPVATARADGILNRYVEVGPSLAGLAVTTPAATEAVLGHEWAHHGARDIAPSRFAWWSAVALAAIVVPFVFVVWDAGGRRATEALARLLVVLLLVAAARAAVLRAREIDADLTARRRSPAGLVEALRAGGQATDSEGLMTVLADHPSPRRRLDVAAEPRLACRLGLIDAWLVGLTTAVAAPVITRLVRAWFQFGDPAFYAEMFGWALTGTLLGAWLAAMMLRAVAAGRSAGTAVDLRWFALCLAVALLVGGFVLGTPLLQAGRGLPSTVTAAAATALLALGLVAVAVWLRGAVGWWLDAGLARRSRTVAVLAATLTGAAIGGLALGLLKHVEGLAADLDERPLSLGLELDPDQPFTLVRLLLAEAETPIGLVLAALAVIVPVALAWLAPTAHTGVPRWLRPAPGDVMPAGWGEGPVSWRAAAGIGIAAGAVAIACYAVFVVVWGPDDHAADAGWWASAQTQVAAEAIVGGIAGAGAAGAALVLQRARSPLAGLAGAAAAVVGAAGAWAVRSADRDGFEAASLDDLAGDIAAVAVVTALVLAALFALAPRVTAPPRWRLAVAAAAPLLAAVVLVGAGATAVDAVASPERDLAYYRSRLASGLDEGVVSALAGCQQGLLTAGQFQDLSRAGSVLADPAAAPSRAELRAVHSDLVGAIGTCLTAARLDAGGQVVLAGDAAAVVSERLGRFVAAARALGLLDQ